MNGFNWVAPVVVGVLVLAVIGIGNQFLARGTTITVLERQVAVLEEAVRVFSVGFKDIDREHRGIELNGLRITHLEELHKGR